MRDASTFFYLYGNVDTSLQMPCGNKSNESNKLNTLRFILRRGELTDRRNDGGNCTRYARYYQSPGSRRKNYRKP